MGALGNERARRPEYWKYKSFTLLSGSVAYKGGRACLNSSGKVVPASSATGLFAIGMFAETVDATDSDLPVTVELDREVKVERFANATDGGAVASTDVGDIAYMLDDQTVTMTATSRSIAGRVWDVSTTKGVAIEALQAPDLLTLDDVTNAAIKKKSVTIAYNHASFLAEGDDGDAVDINVGTALPTGALLLAAKYTINTPFAGAGLATLTMIVGYSGDTNGVFEAVDILGDAAAQYGGTLGTAMGPMLASGKQLVANFDPDASAGLDELTAGSITIDVFYITGDVA